MDILLLLNTDQQLSIPMTRAKRVGQNNPNYETVASEIKPFDGQSSSISN